MKSCSVLVSIVLPVYGRLDYTKQCLRSLYADASSVSFEVIVVDNGSTDETPDFLAWAQANYGIRVIRNKHNVGFARACNQGSAVARGSLLLFLNNDTIVRRGWLEPMVEVLRREPRVGVVGPKLLYPDGRIQHAGMVIADAPAPISPGHLHRGRPQDFPPANIQRDFQAVTGACLLIRRDVFEQVRGFDEGYMNDCEDVDLCFKVRQNGWRVVYTPKSVLTHFESVTEGRFDHSAENLILLNRRWANSVRPDYHRALPRVSIVLLNYNGTSDTIECLKSLYGYHEAMGFRPEFGLYYKPFQTIVVDNASKENEVRELRKWLRSNGVPHERSKPGQSPNRGVPFQSHVVLLESPENLGFAGGCNAGIARALASGADFVWILNNDTVVHPLALWKTVEFFLHALKAGMRVGAVGSKLYDFHHPERVQFDGDRVYYGGVSTSQCRNTDKVDFKSFVSGASVLLSRQALEECGGFDESFFLYFEDNDLCLRLNRSGWRVAFHPKSIVYHKGGASLGDWIGSPLSVYYATRNFLLFREKHLSVDMETFKKLRNIIWHSMPKNEDCVRAFIKGVADFAARRFGRTVPEQILEGWEHENQQDREGLPGRVLHRLEEVLVGNPNALHGLDTLFQLALAHREKLSRQVPKAGTALCVLSAAVRGKKACWILPTLTKVILGLERRDFDWQRALWG